MKKKKLSKKKIKIRDVEKEFGINFPKTRQDCSNIPRPCPFARCRHNTFLDINQSSGKLKIIFPNCESPADMKSSNCSLDIVDERGMMTLEDIGRFMNITRERVRQIADAGMRKLRVVAEND